MCITSDRLLVSWCIVLTKIRLSVHGMVVARYASSGEARSFECAARMAGLSQGSGCSSIVNLSGGNPTLIQRTEGGGGSCILALEISVHLPTPCKAGLLQPRASRAQKSQVSLGAAVAPVSQTFPPDSLKSHITERVSERDPAC